MFLYSIEKFMTSFLRHAMWFRALASMPLTHIIPWRVSNMYNTCNRVIQFILVSCFISWFIIYPLRKAKPHCPYSWRTRTIYQWFHYDPISLSFAFRSSIYNFVWFLCPNLRYFPKGRQLLVGLMCRLVTEKWRDWSRKERWRSSRNCAVRYGPEVKLSANLIRQSRRFILLTRIRRNLEDLLYLLL